MLITAVGNMEHDEIMRQAEKSFRVPNQANSSPGNIRTFEQNDYRAFVDRRKKPFGQAHLLYGRAVPRNDSFFYTLLLLNTILSGGMSSMLNLELREQRPLAYNVYSSLTFFDDATLLNIYAGTESEHTEEALSIIKNILSVDNLSGISQEELLAAKNRLLGSMIMETEQMTQRMSKAARDIFYFGKAVSLEEKISGVNEITRESLGDAALYLQRAEASTLVYEPEEE